MTTDNPVVLTRRFSDAVDYARIAHGAQVRKGTDVPYLSHLLGVASLVLAYGGDENQVIAGLLHDVVEDCGALHEAAIRAQFGDAVADIVKACTDGTAEKKAESRDPEARRLEWLRRKLKYIEQLRDETADALLVSACDKLQNASAIVEDLENPAVGREVFRRFKGTAGQTLGYYQSIADILRERNSPVFRTFDATVARMHELAGITVRVPLEQAGPRV
jgi:(p)ppGpp synthase/HD superfamily hydrolase